ncbi:MAG: type II secretion system protein [Patescibacteria group bacterium]
MKTRFLYNKGFTLIELLVVIAIIGLLSSIVLASLNSARAKGADAAIKANLAGIRAQAEILYDTNSGYGVDTTPTAFSVGACAATADTLFFDLTIRAALIAAGNASNAGGLGRGSCVSTANAWAASVPLKGTATNSWCVDSTGASKQVTPAGGDRGFLSGVCK